VKTLSATKLHPCVDDRLFVDNFFVRVKKGEAILAPVFKKIKGIAF
jgi:hypothetical protein